jgi:diguanylate cyclase
MPFASEEPRQAGDGVSAQLDGILATLEAASWWRSEYGAKLSAMAQRSESVDQRTLVEILHSLSAATAEAEAKNRELTARLAASRQEIADLQGNLKSVRAESALDGLTQLSNRKHFERTLRAALAQSRIGGRPLSLLMCDIDHFKRFNDTHGHLTGDRIIAHVGAMLRQTVRDHDLAARYGGEEFAIILPNTSLAQAVVVAERIRAAVSGSELVKRVSGESVGRVTLSVGAAEARETDSIQSLIDQADTCLYRAKHQGRNRVAAASAE